MRNLQRIVHPRNITSAIKRITCAIGIQLLAIIAIIYATKFITHVGVERISTHHTISTVIPYGYAAATIVYIAAFIATIVWSFTGLILQTGRK